jgi:hypothetical protein
MAGGQIGILELEVRLRALQRTEHALAALRARLVHTHRGREAPAPPGPGPGLARRRGPRRRRPRGARRMARMRSSSGAAIIIANNARSCSCRLQATAAATVTRVASLLSSLPGSWSLWVRRCYMPRSLLAVGWFPPPGGITSCVHVLFNALSDPLSTDSCANCQLPLTRPFITG